MAGIPISLPGINIMPGSACRFQDSPAADGTWVLYLEDLQSHLRNPETFFFLLFILKENRTKCEHTVHASEKMYCRKQTFHCIGYSGKVWALLLQPHQEIPLSPALTSSSGRVFVIDNKCLFFMTFIASILRSLFFHWTYVIVTANNYFFFITFSYFCELGIVLSLFNVLQIVRKLFTLFFSVTLIIFLSICPLCLLWHNFQFSCCAETYH